jgi:polyphosphate kinase 2 (PPK2 family)
VALDEPTVAERTQWYFQRYVAQLPSGGELVLMNRSWYNRAGVERVMDYCTTEDYDEFLRTVPEFERMLIGSSVRIVKLWFTVEQAEQQRRFDRMRDDPLGQWRLSPTDIAGMSRWDAYRTAEETMFARTDAPDIPWMVVRADDRRRARLEAMRYVLSRFEYPGKDPQVAHAPDTRVVGRPRRREDAADE